MNIIKGFSSLPALANNAPGQTAIFGELSPESLTFSKFKTNYANPTLYAGVEFVGFTTMTGGGSQITLSNTVSNHILSVAKWVYDQYNISAIPPNANKASFIAQLESTFPDMTNIEINEILNATLTQRMPDYIAWHFLDGAEDNEIKVWFNDARFKTQYDDYTIIVLPPVHSVDQLNNPTASTAAFLNGYTSGELIADIAAQAGVYPYTRLVSLTLTWHDPTLPTATLQTTWTAIVYGLAGNDNDNIKAQIRSYIAANSALTNWEIIYPTLYAENEFTIIPSWTDIASPESGLDVALYNTAIDVGPLLNKAASLIPSSYGSSVVLSSYLMSNLNVVSAFWRGISFLAIGNPGNVGSQFKFRQKFPDYMNIQPTSTDWGRISLLTRNFIVALNAALEKALILTETGSIPVGYTRSIRDGKVYLGFNYDGFTYLILAKISHPV